MLDSPIILTGQPRTLQLFAKRLVAAGIAPDRHEYSGQWHDGRECLIFWPFPGRPDFGFFLLHPIPDGSIVYRASKFDHALKIILMLNNVLTVNKLNNNG